MDPENVKNKTPPPVSPCVTTFVFLEHFLTNILVDLQRGWMFLVLCLKWGTAQITWTFRTKTHKKPDTEKTFEPKNQLEIGETLDFSVWASPHCYTHQPLDSFPTKKQSQISGAHLVFSENLWTSLKSKSDFTWVILGLLWRNICKLFRDEPRSTKHLCCFRGCW